MKVLDKYLAAAFSAAMLVSGCALETAEEVPRTEGNVRMEIALKDCFRTAGGTKTADGTKSSLGDGVEDIFSGTVIGVYMHMDGRLLHTAVISPGECSHEMSLPKGTYDIRAIANLKLIGPDGNATDLRMPERLSRADSLCYRLGGKDIDGAWAEDGLERFRTETFAEMALYGIPRTGKKDNYVLDDDSVLEIPLKALLSKLTVNIAHPGVEGSIVDRSLSARNSNGALRPFREAFRAEGPDDTIDMGDFEPVTSGSSNTSYVLYLPENVQGRLLPDNADPARKNANVLAAAAGPVVGLCTYIELGAQTGAVAEPEDFGGYGGHVKYRFYPGEDSTSDFSIVRNTECTINLRLTVNGIFVGNWKSGRESDFFDDREFCFSRTDVQEAMPGDQAITEDDIVAVRKNRPGSCYVWFNRMDGLDWEANHGAAPVNWDHSPSDIRTTCWTSDFLSPDPSYFDTPLYFELQACGITPRYDSRTHKLTFTVTDPSRFIPGKEFVLSAWMIPGDRNRKATLRLKTLEDIEVHERNGLSLSTGFYTGMKRTVQIRGLAGESVSYTFSQTGGISRTPSLTGPYHAGTVYSKSSGELADEEGKFSGIPLYGYSTGGTSRIDFTSSDPFNDDIGSITVTVRKPYYAPPESSICWVPIDGSTVSYNAEGPWTDMLGNVIETSRFDSENYDVWLGLEAVSGENGSNPDYVWSDNSTVYMRRITLTGTKPMTARPKRAEMGTGSCTITFTPGIPAFESGPDVPTFCSRDFDDIGLSGREADPYFADMRHPIVLEQEARLNLHGNSYDDMTIEESGDFIYDARGEWVYENSSGRLHWKWTNLANGGHDFLYGTVPCGSRSATFTVRNRHSGEEYRISSSWDYTYHVRLGCYAVFSTDTEYADIIICTGKEYQALQKYVSGHGTLPSPLGCGSINGYEFGSELVWESSLQGGTVRGNRLTASSRNYRSAAFPHGNGTWTREMVNEVLYRQDTDPFYAFARYVRIDGLTTSSQPYELCPGIYLYPQNSNLEFWGYSIIR